MSKAIQRFSLDVTHPDVQASVRIMQGDDNRQWRFTFTNGGQPFILPARCTAMLVGTKPDDTVIENGLVVQGNEVIYDFGAADPENGIEQISTVPGSFEVQILLFDEYGAVLHAPRLWVTVFSSSYTERMANVSMDQLGGIKELIARLVGAEVSLEKLLGLMTSQGTVTIAPTQWTNTTPYKADIFMPSDVFGKGCVVLFAPEDDATKEAAGKAMLSMTIGGTVDNNAPTPDYVVIARAEGGEAPTIPLNFRYIVLKTGTEDKALVAMVGVDAVGALDEERVNELIKDALKVYEPPKVGNEVSIFIDGVKGTSSHSASGIYKLSQEGTPLVAVLDGARYFYGGVVSFNEDGDCDTVEFFRTEVNADGAVYMEAIHVHNDNSADVINNSAAVGGGGGLTDLEVRMLINEVVPKWALSSNKPSYTASEVGADPANTAATKVSEHDAYTGSHQDIRLLIKALQEQVNKFLDVDDTTRDELSEVLALIDANADTLESLTSGKVNVTDIVNNLTTNVPNKPLSAAQGVALKALIDALSTGKLDASALTSEKIAEVLGFTPANADNVPTKLSQLEGDSMHRTATDKEKSDWNARQTAAQVEAAITTALEPYITEETADEKYVSAAAIPTKVSQLSNDSGYITQTTADGRYAKSEDIPTTPSEVGADPAGAAQAVAAQVAQDLANYYKKSESYSRTEIDSKISAIPKFAISVVSSLPTSGISTTTVYLVKNKTTSGDLYTEYIYVNNAWEELGKQTVNLSGYVTTSALNTALASYAKTSDIPTKTSQLTNDSNFAVTTNAEAWTLTMENGTTVERKVVLA